MKKYILKVMLLLVIIMILFCNVCYAAKSNKKMSAYKQISAFKIKLENGTTLIDSTVQNGTNVEIKNIVKNIKIVFVLDESGSMASGRRMEVLKNSTKNLITSIDNQYGQRSDVEIGIITFSSGINNTLPLTKISQTNTIYEFINRMNTGGGTHMYEALEKAYTMLDDDKDDAFKMIITLTDGGLSDSLKTIQYMRDTIHGEESNIFTTSIFVETRIPDTFVKELKNEIDIGKHTNMNASSEGMENLITEKLYNLISERIVEISDPSVSFNINQDYVGILDNIIIAQVDTEIIHGATLYIEYVISTTATFDTQNIIFIDFLDDVFQYNENQKLLTEDKTNKENGWKYENGYIWLQSEHEIKAGTEYNKKIILSTVLTGETLENTSKYSNTASVFLQNGEGELIRKENLKAFDFYIIPPTGNSTRNSNIICIGIITVCIIILLYIFISRKTIIINKNRKKV